MLLEYSNCNAGLLEGKDLKTNEEIEKYLMITSTEEDNNKDYLENLLIAKPISYMVLLTSKI